MYYPIFSTEKQVIKKPEPNSYVQGYFSSFESFSLKKEKGIDLITILF